MSVPVDTIICGDNCEVLRTFPSGCIDLVVTSPPYDDLRTYGGHSWDFELLALELWRVLKVGGVVVWVVDDQVVNGSETGTSFRQALRFMDFGFNLHDTMIWNKIDAAPGDGKHRYHQAFEYMFVLSKHRPKTTNIIRDVPCKSHGITHHRTSDRRRDQTNTRWERKPWTGQEHAYRRNVWQMTHGGKQSDAVAFKHPAIFPEALARDHILSWSNEGDIVLDPFNGSGTTTKMAREMGRRYIGIEVNEEYCEIARARLAQQLLPF